MKNAAKETNKQLAKHLRDVRQEENFTMRALAEVLGTPHSFIGKIEQQGRRLDVGEFIHYCKAMNRDPVKVLESVMEL